jgi:hypothetical protein
MSQHQPCTFVSMSLCPGSAPHVSISFHTPHLKARAGLVLDDTRPFLEFYSSEADVHISTTTGAGPVTEADVNTAREIFTAAARYLAECERLHAEQAGKDATDTAA